MAVRDHIKVLVIDDDPSICKTVGLLLEDHGFAPTMFTDPEAAIESVKKESFQVALIDLRMPAMDGVDVVSALKKIDPRCSCIVMTAYPDLDSATETMRRGSCDYIAQPFKPEEPVASAHRARQRMGSISTNDPDLNRLSGQRIPPQRLTHTITTVSALGIFRDQNTPLSLVSFVGIAILIWIYQSQRVPTGLLRLSLGLQIGGAVGNLLDRLRLGHVTDFVDVGDWPIFNVADASIITGLVILAWIFLVADHDGSKVSDPAGHAGGYGWCPVCDGEMRSVMDGWRCSTCGVKERTVDEGAGDGAL